MVGKPPLAQCRKTADYTTKNHRWAKVGPLMAKSADHTLLGHWWNVIWDLVFSSVASEFMFQKYNNFMQKYFVENLDTRHVAVCYWNNKSYFNGNLTFL